MLCVMFQATRCSQELFDPMVLLGSDLFCPDRVPEAPQTINQAPPTKLSGAKE